MIARSRQMPPDLADHERWERIRQAGTEAHGALVPQKNNPYPRGTEEWCAWDLGWIEAE